MTKQVFCGIINISNKYYKGVGERIGRIVSEEKAAKSDKQRAIEALVGSVPFPEEYNDPNHDPDYELLREAAYKDRGLL